jgi:carboxyl-terminal processing protease
MPPGFLGDTLKEFFQKKTTKAALLGVVLGVVLTGAVGVGLLGGFSGTWAAARFAAVLRVVQTQYVGEYDIQELTEDAMSAVIAGLDDRWSYYMDEETYDSYQDYSANRYQGIGVTITKDETTGGFTVVSITKDGPAQTAGMTVGDIILAVDGVSVTEGDTGFVRELIQADYDQTARVTVLRENGDTVDFDVSCEAIYTSPVSYQMLENDVGYVAITNFRQGAASNAIEAIEALREQGATSLVLDVRSNPGGQVTELVELLDYLLPEGDIFIRADKKGREVVETSDAACLEMPMAVLVNGDSYSAAEYFAAALREYDWATVVGEPTTGKARSQVTIPLWDGGAVHLSKYTYLTPQRQDLYEAGGLVPDVEIDLTEQQRSDFDTGWLEPSDDPQIQGAIDALGA